MQFFFVCMHKIMRCTVELNALSLQVMVVLRFQIAAKFIDLLKCLEKEGSKYTAAKVSSNHWQSSC